MLLRVAWKSLLNRKVTVLLTVLSITVSVFVLLGVEHIRHEAKTSFSKTVSGTDLIVGARTGQLNLLLYSVFRIGNATNNISWQSYQELSANPSVAWSIPLSLGDSHRGYRVMGTTQDYFQHFKYGKNSALEFAQGQPFAGLFDTVLGAEVARKLGYQVGQKIVIAHGTGSTSFSKHDDKPFTVVGILETTGTPVDQTVHVSLAAIEAIHTGWQSGVKPRGTNMPADEWQNHDLTPKTITAFMLGLKSKIATFTVQRQINNYRKEPLLAILPGAALSELWLLLGSVEKVLFVISVLVLTASLLGMCTMLLASMRERQRELAVIRAVGAHPSFIFLLIELEALIIAVIGIVSAIGLLWLTLSLSQNYFSDAYGLFIETDFFSSKSAMIIGIMLAATSIVSLIPAVSAYRSSLSSGLTVKS